MSYEPNPQQLPPQQPYYQPPQGGAPAPYGQHPSDAGSSDDRTWAMVGHLGSFLTAWIALGIIAPILVLIAKSRSAFVRHHAYESLNFQLNGLVWIAITTVLSIVTLGLGVVFFLPVGLWYLVFVIIASVRANAGEWYRYPLIVRVFNP